jgi:hypothetical protein
VIAVAAAKLAAANVDGLVYDELSPEGNVFVEHMPSTPDIAVMVKSTGGLPQLTKHPTDLPTVQFLVRGAAHNPRPPWLMALAIYDLFACLDLATLDEGGDDEVYVISCTPQQSAPIGIGLDENRRPEYSLNFSLRTYAPTAQRT